MPNLQGYVDFLDLCDDAVYPHTTHVMRVSHDRGVIWVRCEDCKSHPLLDGFPVKIYRERLAATVALEIFIEPSQGAHLEFWKSRVEMQILILLKTIGEPMNKIEVLESLRDGLSKALAGLQLEDAVDDPEFLEALWTYAKCELSEWLQLMESTL